jgi:hypothetical protein
MPDCCGFIRSINTATLFNPCYVLKLRVVRGLMGSLTTLMMES